MTDEIPEKCPLHPVIEGALANRSWRQRNPSLFGFLIASTIFTIVVYALMFDARSNDVQACEGRNSTRTELNQRGHTTQNIIDILVGARQGPGQVAREGGYNQQNADEAKQLLKDSKRIDFLAQLDCEAEYPKPWPFG